MSIWYYLDQQGLFGEPGGMVTDTDLIEYWNENYAEDPVLSGYDGFNEWYRETRAQLTRIG